MAAVLTRWLGLAVLCVVLGAAPAPADDRIRVYEEIATTDRTVERQVLDAIARAL